MRRPPAMRRILGLAGQRLQRLQVRRITPADQAGGGSGPPAGWPAGPSRWLKSSSPVAPGELFQRLEPVVFHCVGQFLRRSGRSRRWCRTCRRACRARRAPAICATSDAASRRGTVAGRTCRAGRRRHGRRPCSGPCRLHRWRPGSRPPCPDTARPGRCGCAGDRRAHDDRAAAPPAADQLGDRVYLARRKTRPRPCAAAGVPASPARQSAVATGGGRGLDLRLRHQALQQRTDGLGPEEHGLHHAAGVQQAVGEDVGRGPHRRRAGSRPRRRTRRRGSSGIASTVHAYQRAFGGTIFFLAGDQGDVLHALQRHHSVVVFTREQTQREADDAGRVREQPLDREVRLARVGGPEHGLHTRGESPTW